MTTVPKRVAGWSVLIVETNPTVAAVIATTGFMAGETIEVASDFASNKQAMYQAARRGDFDRVQSLAKATGQQCNRVSALVAAQGMPSIPCTLGADK